MDTPQLEAIGTDWDDRVLGAHSSPHFMQSRTWAEIRAGGPWHVASVELSTGRPRPHPALAYEREVAGVGRLRHLPRVSGIDAADVSGLTASLRERGGAFATKIELYQPRDAAIEAAFSAEGWLPTKASQYRFAVIVDLSKGSEAALADMKKRARAEIRVGERNAVSVERGEIDGEDAAEMIELVRATEERSGAFFRDDEYLRRVWTRFAESGHGRLYLARHDGRVVAGAFVVRFGRNAWYKDGGSTREFPHLMASRLLQWRIMQELADEGVEAYDLGHVPPPGNDHPAGRGVLIFKSAFAPGIVEYLPAYLLPHEAGADRWRRDEAAFLADYRAETGDYWY